MPIISIFGTLSAGSTFIPLWALNAPCRLDIGLNSNEQAITKVSGFTAASFVITKPHLNLTLVSISDVAQSQIQSMCGNQFLWHSTVWRTHKSIHAALQTTDTITVPARVDSLKSILTVQRPTAALETLAYHSNLCRTRNCLSNFQWRIGSSFANPKPVDCTGSAVEAFMDARRVFGNVTSESNPTLIAYKDWTIDAVVSPAATRTAGNADHGSFLIALEAEPFSQSKGGLISGTSTLASSAYLDLVYSGTIAAVDITSFVECDALFSCDATIGSLTVKF
jgi:hypothetical protein